MQKHEVISSIIDNIRRLFQILNEHSKKAEHQTGLTSPQLWAIKVISEHSPIRVMHLARYLYLHPATVVGILDRLETRGLVVRKRSREDRRVVWVELTDKGKHLVEEAPEVAQGLLVAGLEKMSETILIRINKALTKLVEIIGAAEIPPRLIMSSEINIPQNVSKVK